MIERKVYFMLAPRTIFGAADVAYWCVLKGWKVRRWDRQLQLFTDGMPDVV